MQAVSELTFLDVADEAVDPGDCLRRAGGRIEPEVGLDALGLRLGANIVLQTVAALRVQPVRIGELVQQGFQACQTVRRPRRGAGAEARAPA